MAKIGLIDNDLVVKKRHNFPNLAIMKLSNYHKQKGDEVELIGFNEINPNSLFGNNFDLIYVSKAFTNSETPDYIFKLDNVKKGGTGFYLDKAEPLFFEVEHTMPDYSIYDKILHTIKKKTFYTDYSIGFTTRGCFRHCSFCVNKNLNKVELHSPIDEFYEPSKSKLALLDDNLLGLSNKKLFKIFDRLEEIGKPFQYRQGMDIRLLTEERIKKLLNFKYDGDYYFAFDIWEQKKYIEPKMKLFYENFMKKYPNRKSYINTKMFVFIGFDKTEKYNELFWINEIETMFKRIEICFKYKMMPSVMHYYKCRQSKYRKFFIELIQWSNQPRNCGTHSLNSYIETAKKKGLKEFRDKHPSLRKYFNLKLQN